MNQIISILGIGVCGFLWITLYTSNFASDLQPLMLLSTIMAVAIPTASNP